MPSPSVLAQRQMVVLYGVPGNPDLGVLGMFGPAEATQQAVTAAAGYDRINGSDGVTPALDLVYGQAQAEPTDDGLYLRYLSDNTVRDYLAAADQSDVQLILDLQIGRGDPLEEVRKIEPYLRDPRVHVAIDPEYAVGPGGIPGDTPGLLTADQINAVQDYLSGLVSDLHLPPKVLVIHQYLEDTVVDTPDARTVPGVDLTFNMDAFGAIDEKIRKYAMFADRAPAARHGFNVFLRHDDWVMSDEDVLQLNPRPDVIFYQ